MWGPSPRATLSGLPCTLPACALGLPCGVEPVQPHSSSHLREQRLRELGSWGAGFVLLSEVVTKGVIS